MVDNGSQDGTAAAVRRALPTVRVIELPGNVGGYARTIGARFATTPYIAFADDDSWWAPGALRRAVAYFDAHPRMGLLAARILVGPEDQLDPICKSMCDSALGWDPDLPHHHPSSNREGSAQRRVSIVRSRLLTAVLRRSWSFVLRESVRQLRSGRDGRAGLTATVARLRPALRARQRTSRLVEGELNRLRRDAQATDGSFTAPRTGYEAG